MDRQLEHHQALLVQQLEHRQAQLVDQQEHRQVRLVQQLKQFLQLNCHQLPNVLALLQRSAATILNAKFATNIRFAMNIIIQILACKGGIINTLLLLKIFPCLFHNSIFIFSFSFNIFENE
ncbi:unnamed protein product [Meloidogyne enterolobii]|uniref:Uncharacterized protein n=1 Tax=Meloidogyne enterolobii TaxID=390850 RepID=A0ACB1A3N0_MELEN